MSRQNALFFPYINVPSTPWFVQALLYWDSVQTIMPADFWSTQYSLNAYSREVMQAGLVQSLYPGEQLAKMPTFGEEFMAVLKARMDSPSFRRRVSLRNDVASIHVEKLHGVTTELQQRGLIGRESQGWVQMPGWLANLFMTYLAACLGQLRDCSSTPITNHPECWAHLAAIPLGSLEGEADLQLARNNLVSVALPVPASAPAPHELAAFKEKHRERLARLRIEIEATAAHVAGAKGRTREALLTKARCNIETQINDVAEAMRSRWEVVFWSALAVLPPGLQAATVAAQTSSVATAATSALGTALAVQRAVASARARDRVADGSPFAYGAAYQNRFNPSRHRRPF